MVGKSSRAGTRIDPPLSYILLDNIGRLIIISINLFLSVFRFQLLDPLLLFV